jgi:hypothetical protein
MGDPSTSKMDDAWVSLFTKSLANLTGDDPQSLQPAVERFHQAMQVAKLKIEKAGGGRLTLATTNAPVKLRLTALNSDDRIVTGFTGTATLSATDKTLATDPMQTAAFVGGVLDGVEVKFKAPNSSVVLTAQAQGASSTSEPFVVLPAMVKPRPGKALDVYNKTEKARAVLAGPPTNPGSAALAELRARRPAFALNNAPTQSEAAKKTGNFNPDDLENCGAVSLGAICGKSSTQVVEDYLRLKLRDQIAAKLAIDRPDLKGSQLDLALTQMLDTHVNDFKTIQNQSIYWRAESLKNLTYNFGEPQEGMPTNPYGEECGDAQLAANREMLVAEAKRRNDGGGVGGVKYKVVQDGLNDSENGKFYDPRNGELQAQMAKYPDGSQFQVFLNGPQFAGHWIYAEKYNGKIVMEDYQKALVIGKKGATAYTDGDVPHNPKNDEPDVFARACFIALCPESADETAIGAWAENPKWPQGGTPGRVQAPTAKTAEPSGPAAPESVVMEAVTDGTVADKVTDPEFRRGLLNYLGKPGAPDADTSKKLLQAFRVAPEDDAVLREAAFKKVFDCKLTSEGELPPKILNKMVDVLESLPQDLLPKVWKMKARKGKITTGMYNEQTRGGEIVYGADDAPDFGETYDANCPEESMGLRGSKNFDLIIRHEVGHDVDVKRGGAGLTQKPHAGAWKKHGGRLEVLKELSDVVDDYINALEQSLNALPAEFGNNTRKELKESFYNFMTEAACVDASALKSNLAKFLSGEKRLKQSASLDQIAGKVPADHLLVRLMYQGARDDNWAHFGGAPISHNNRVYLLKSDGDWYSFDVSSWGNRISNYQYASPGEWFAEFYAGINNSDKAIRKKCAAAYPEAKSWLGEQQMLLYPNE